ncbi:TPA: terminus macrodomain insulation protein YfbV, partial [Yersinia enterocolitica]
MTTKPSDSVSWFQVLQRGQLYMKTWPANKRLATVFPENRVVTATRFGIRFMPPLAIFTLTWQIALGGQLGP